MTATEKAAPIPADVLALAERLRSMGQDIRSWGPAYRDRARADMLRAAALLADRASQEERIREDEPLPERLRKSYEKGAQDERDRLYKAGLKWPRDVCDFLEIEGAKVRARLRGDAS